ncbi:hypothetical protein AGMMS49959_16090 [Planctomycetales bacterium]|nr:hypothetical protein AGMMS49959_16090 [Planctomycetales bacterium]
MAKEAAAILHDRPYTGQALADLVKLGGSSGGARPKVLLTIDGEEWLVKFRAALDPKNIGKKEYQYALLARKAGLDFPATRLFAGKYFGVQRFDRCAGAKVFMLSASALLDASHRYPTLDYVDLLNAALKLTRDFGEAEKLFRQMCFNVFYHNRDDHAKNFSFLYTGNRWTVSPPYDLVYAEGMGDEHATTIDGAGKDPTADDIMRVAAKTGIKNARKIMEEVGKAGDSLVC